MIAPGEDLEDLAEFDCGCYVRVIRGWTLSVWQCPAGDNCPGWRLILAELSRCVGQLRIHALGRSL